jgi:hypothetical protein
MRCPQDKSNLDANPDKFADFRGKSHAAMSVVVLLQIGDTFDIVQQVLTIQT